MTGPLYHLGRFCSRRHWLVIAAWVLGLFASVLAGGVASTFTVLLPPASIVIVWALAWALGDAVTIEFDAEQCCVFGRAAG